MIEKINNKIFVIFFALFIFALFFVLNLNNDNSKIVNAEESPDAIAIRVIPNPEHYSPMRWYNSRGFKGAPQSLIVDGYEAVRDGRTVYVNAANIKDDKTELFTNIYLISYNQEAEDNTIDIFGRILSHWKFNSNINDAGICTENNSRVCKLDSDCEGAGYCKKEGKCADDGEICFGNADCSDGVECQKDNRIVKAELVRDTKRLSQLAEIDIALENYKNNNNEKYPTLNSGTYLSNQTVSTWPSWQETFAKELGVPLPVDPINDLGPCDEPGYNSITCWNESEKKFAGSVEDDKLVLPNKSQAFVYSSNYNGSEANLCAVMESGLLSKYEEGACPGSETLDLAVGERKATENSAPILSLNCPPVECKGLDYKIYIRATDYDNDFVNFSLDNIEAEPYWSDHGWVTSDPSSNFPVIDRADNQFNIAEIDFNNAGDYGNYSFDIVADDGNGGVASSTCNIKVYESSEVFEVTVSEENTTIYNSPEGVDVPYYNVEYLVTLGVTGSPVSYSLIEAPDWVSLDGNKVFIAEDDKSEVKDIGTYNITVEAVTNCGARASKSFSINVIENKWCGDKITQNGENGTENFGETCDDGNSDNNDSCLDTCVSASCGDRFVQPGEECDDGDKDDANNCTNSCTASYCGDGFTQNPNAQSVAELCDDGAGNTDNPGVPGYGDSSDYCDTSCQSKTISGPACEDGNLDINKEEECEVVLGYDNCAGCKCETGYEKSGGVCCGDFTLNQIANSEIWLYEDIAPLLLYHGPTIYNGDSASVAGTNLVKYPIIYSLSNNPFLSINENGIISGSPEPEDIGTHKITLTAVNSCGISKSIDFDVIVSPNEWCGDGDLQDNGADGLTNTTDDEQCDAGVNNNDTGNVCTKSCKFPVCGDGIRGYDEFGVLEQCDDGNENNGDGCTTSCLAEICGDGRIGYDQFGILEECDGGECCEPDCRISAPVNGELIRWNQTQGCTLEADSIYRKTFEAVYSSPQCGGELYSGPFNKKEVCLTICSNFLSNERLSNTVEFVPKNLVGNNADCQIYCGDRGYAAAGYYGSGDYPCRCGSGRRTDPAWSGTTICYLR